MNSIWLYSHDGEGLGHLRRNLNIATAATAEFRDLSAVLLTGSPFSSLFQMPRRSDSIKIPAVSKTGSGKYRPVARAFSDEQAAQLRARLLKDALRSAPPDVLVVDKHPAGLNGELLPALRWLRKNSPKTRIFLGLRDILDEGRAVRNEWSRESIVSVIRRFYHRIWIYGDPRVFDSLATYDWSPEVARKARYCGYVLAELPRKWRPVSGAAQIVASVGGGSDGFEVLHAVIRSYEELSRTFPNLQARIFAGPMMPRASFRKLRQRAAALSGIVIERFSKNFLLYASQARAVVSMAGYNSAAELVAMGCCPILVPRCAPRREQLVRAEAFEKLGLARLVPPQDIVEGALTKAIRLALNTDSAAGAASHVANFNGYAQILRDLRHTIRTGTVEKLLNV